MGILAAFALPKFADLSGDAERSACAGGLGAAKSAAGIAHAAYLAGGSTDPTIEGTTYTMVNGYPAAGDFTIRENGVANRIMIEKGTGNVYPTNLTPQFLSIITQLKPHVRNNIFEIFEELV